MPEGVRSMEQLGATCRIALPKSLELLRINCNSNKLRIGIDFLERRHWKLSEPSFSDGTKSTGESDRAVGNRANLQAYAFRKLVAMA
jgi:hypothetical protein